MKAFAGSSWIFGARSNLEMQRRSDSQYEGRESNTTSLRQSYPASFSPIDNRITLQTLVGRTSLEVFGNDGRVSMRSCFLSDLKNTNIAIYASGGEAKIISPDVYELRSAWL